MAEEKWISLSLFGDGKLELGAGLAALGVRGFSFVPRPLEIANLDERLKSGEEL